MPNIDYKQGPIQLFMAGAHGRLDAMLEEAEAAGQINFEAYQEFRRGLLKQISMEEKILYPAAQRQMGEPLALAARLRLDHGALAALVALAPSVAIIAAIRAVLAAHNPLEEGSDGAYAICDRVLAGDLKGLLTRLRNAPEVRTAECVSGAGVLAATKRVLIRAGYSDLF